METKDRLLNASSLLKVGVSKGIHIWFLHIKDHVDITSQRPEGDVVAAKQKSELCADEGLKDSTERLGLQPPGFPDASASSVAYNTSFSSERILSLEHPLGTQKLLDCDREHCASRSTFLLWSSSPFSGTESENLPLFRTSSIEQPNLGDGFPKVSSSSPGTSIQSARMRMINGDPVSLRTLGPDYSSDKYSISSHCKFHGNVLDKNCYGKDLSTTEAETGGTSVAEQKNRITLLKEKLLNLPRVKDIAKANKTDIDSGLQRNGPRNKKELKVDRGRASNEMDVDLKTYGEMHKESKALKHFRADLVDFVKELVNPTWREGHLSKDAHNMIVKKAVDNVPSTLQPHHIPSTIESIKQYLSSSQPKISRLIEGYVEKYGKS
ncbi:hypothetical protein F0562_014014 [Nyssa sinensis]|uniref:Set2 Rpb1 interacting domain-containing protein n=1 Tax=Nyssa sinensis TaxID=561372 RepID=A0A5J4ZPZ3_9ASTE|nr:hypothetical protein F0562_014014 [Nyssa sinensis]